jgi:hypothetical protein
MRKIKAFKLSDVTKAMSLEEHHGMLMSAVDRILKAESKHALYFREQPLFMVG